MKVAIVGFSVEGRASYDYFAAQGHELEIRDQNTELTIPDGVPSVLGEAYLDNLDRFDLIVRTAGLTPRLILEKNPGVEDKITTHLNEFLRVCPTKSTIGVTGTKGKGTTSTLIAEMLKAAGKSVILGGNIGVPLLPLLNELSEESWVVLELSSFQLIDLKQSPHIGICLMVVPEHLDWHPDVDEYTKAKEQLFLHQTADDLAIYYAENALSKLIAGQGTGRKIPYYAAPGATVQNDAITIDNQTICQTSELQLLGAHNWQNVCAAVTVVWQITQDVAAIKSVLASFSGLPHRLSLVRELGGVKYYDDSFGTTPQTAMVAIESFSEPKIVILGGSDKGATYEGLAQTVANHNVRAVLLIGAQAPRIKAALEDVGFTAFSPGGNNMPDIVATAHSLAQAGDVVLLSTACASFDMFKNYKDRGDQFIAAVQALA